MSAKFFTLSMVIVLSCSQENEHTVITPPPPSCSRVCDVEVACSSLPNPEDVRFLCEAQCENERGSECAFWYDDLTTCVVNTTSDYECSTGPEAILFRVPGCETWTDTYEMCAWYPKTFDFCVNACDGDDRACLGECFRQTSACLRGGKPTTFAFGGLPAKEYSCEDLGVFQG